MEEVTDLTKAVYYSLKDYVYSKPFENPKVSVIIPCYNAEKFLDVCLESLIKQTLKEIEIICTNDGSEDATCDVLSAYSWADKRIKVIEQTNQKQGAARNRGLDIATGEYIAFVDADDWVEEDYLELLYNAAEKYNVNIAASFATRDYKHKTKNHFKPNEEKIFYGANNIIEGLKNNLITHSKLYKFEPIKDLRFEEQVYYEDAPYTIKAIQMCGSMVTVPNAHYHYVSNPKSTMKQKLNIKNENDKISTNLQVIDFAEKNNIDLKDWIVIKDQHLLYTTKHYKYRKDYYICRIKAFSKNIQFDNSKNILVFNTACFGDVLLCNSLVQNIKNVFPESKVIFICDKNWYDVAKYQDGVDDVVIYDKEGEHKGLFGMLKFIKNFKYKKPFVSFITYKNERNFIISKLLKSHFVISEDKKIKNLSKQEQHSMLLQDLTHKHVKNLPIKFNILDNISNKVKIREKYIVLCTTSKKTVKDIPIKTAIEFINKINKETDYKVVFTGVGQKAVDYSKELINANCDFIDLTNQTSLLELAQVIKKAEVLISVDTGTMHLGYALNTPTVAIFYEDTTTLWAPNKELYRVKVIKENQNAETIYSNMNNLLSENKKAIQ